MTNYIYTVANTENCVVLSSALCALINASSQQTGIMNMDSNSAIIGSGLNADTNRMTSSVSASHLIENLHPQILLHIGVRHLSIEDALSITVFVVIHINICNYKPRIALRSCTSAVAIIMIYWVCRKGVIQWVFGATSSGTTRCDCKRDGQFYFLLPRHLHSIGIANDIDICRDRPR